MDFVLLQSCFYQWVLHFHLLSNLSFQKGKSKRARLRLSCTILRLMVEQYSLLILLLIETMQKTEREGCTARIFFSGRQLASNGLST